MASSASRADGCAPPKTQDDRAWRDELAHRLETYRGRKRKHTPNVAQSLLPFDGGTSLALGRRAAHTGVGGDTPGQQQEPRGYSRTSAASEILPTAVTLADPESPSSAPEQFSFTIAIGRPPRKRQDDGRMVIDVSLPPEDLGGVMGESQPALALDAYRLQPVAPMEERRLAAVIDAACLLFAYGGLLALFGAVGGEFTFSKLSGAIALATFAIVYLQYFALFTVFGGTTPGMMLRGMQVISLSGEPPTPRQMLLRSAGYLLSAGTFFMGFLWSMWDEDTLTWHDRISRTYLHVVEPVAQVDPAGAPSMR